MEAGNTKNKNRKPLSNEAISNSEFRQNPRTKNKQKRNGSDPDLVLFVESQTTSLSSNWMDGNLERERERERERARKRLVRLYINLLRLGVCSL